MNSLQQKLKFLMKLVKATVSTTERFESLPKLIKVDVSGATIKEETQLHETINLKQYPA